MKKYSYILLVLLNVMVLFESSMYSKSLQDSKIIVTSEDQKIKKVSSRIRALERQIELSKQPLFCWHLMYWLQNTGISLTSVVPGLPMAICLYRFAYKYKAFCEAQKELDINKADCDIYLVL